MANLISYTGFATSLLLASIITLSDGATTVEISWNAEDVAQYRDSALSLHPGDTLTLICPNGSFSNAYRMSHRKQYDNCSCNVTDSSDCETILSCLGIPFSFSLTLKGHKYRSGTEHYLASFSRGRSTGDSIHGPKWGGECVSKSLKMRVIVLNDSNNNVVSVTPSPSVTPTATPTASSDGMYCVIHNLSDTQSMYVHGEQYIYYKCLLAL